MSIARKGALVVINGYFRYFRKCNNEIEFSKNDTLSHCPPNIFSFVDFKL